MKLLGNKVNSTAHDYLEQRQDKQTRVFPSVLKPQSTEAPHSCGEGFSRNYTVLRNNRLPSLPLNSWLNYLISLFSSDLSSVN